MTATNRWNFRILTNDVIDFHENGKNGNSVREYIVLLYMKKAITNSDIVISYTYAYASTSYNKNSTIRLVTIANIVLYSRDSLVKLRVINARKQDHSHFTLNFAVFTILNITKRGDDSDIYLSHTA